MNLTIALGIVGLFITVLELLRTGWQIVKIGWKGWINILITTGATQRTPVDVSLMFLPPPPATRAAIDTLRGLGFRRVGEAQVTMPSKPPVTVWVMTDGDNFVQAQVANHMVEFSTFFKEKVMLVTDFPIGEHIETPTYQSHTILTGIADAYQYHVWQGVGFRQKHGQPHAILNMQEYLHWEKIGRTCYAPMKLRRALWRNVVLLGTFMYGVLALVLVPLLVDPDRIPSLPVASFQLPQEKILFLMVLVTLPVIEAARAWYRWSMAQTRIDSRMRWRFFVKK